MSIRVMSAVWELELPDSEKLVALALADWANDLGECWPSIPQLAKKCSKGERTIQIAVASLESKGHLTRELRPGKGCKYHLHPRSACTTTPAAAAPPNPRKECTPAAAAPAQGTTPTPAAAAPNTSRHTITSGAKAPSVARVRADPFPRPEFADPQHWADFLTNRKRKRLSNTATAHKRLLDDIARLADDEWPPGRLIEFAAARGWGGIYDPRPKQDHRNGNGTGHRPASLYSDRMRDPVLDDLARGRDPGMARQGFG